MKIFVIDTENTVNSKLAYAELKLLIEQQHAYVDMMNAEVVIALGANIANHSELLNKNVAIIESTEVLQDPQKTLDKALQSATRLTELKSITQNSNTKKIVAVTACPTGVAHTFMAAEAIAIEAKKRNWPCKVETRGQVGAGNEISAQEVADADLVIVACDIEVDLSKFDGKPMYKTSTGLIMKHSSQEFDKAIANATIYKSSNMAATAKESKKISPYKHLLTGVSYMLPMVVAGGLIIAMSFMFGIKAFDPTDPSYNKYAEILMTIGGGTAFKLMIPVLAGYIAFSIADRPGLTPGLIGGMLASTIGAGFLGGIVAGYFAGYFTLLLNKIIKLPASMSALKPILILPLISALATGLLMLLVVGEPIKSVMLSLESWLKTMGTGNAIILGAILGGMMCTDLGGPINKVAYAFGVGLLSSHQYAPMAAVMAGGMVPPIAMGIATFLSKNKFTSAERENGKAAIILGACFISEGAIPFAAADPIKVISTSIIGGAITGGLTMLFGSTLLAPHGGIFVLLIPGALSPVLGYILSILVGSAITGVLYSMIKSKPTEL